MHSLRSDEPAYFLHKILSSASVCNNEAAPMIVCGSLCRVFILRIAVPSVFKLRGSDLLIQLYLEFSDIQATIIIYTTVLRVIFQQYFITTLPDEFPTFNLMHTTLCPFILFSIFTSTSITIAVDPQTSDPKKSGTNRSKTQNTATRRQVGSVHEPQPGQTR